MVLESKPTVATEDATPEEDHRNTTAMEGCDAYSSDSEGSSGTELGFGGSVQDHEGSQAGDREIDSQEAWTDAMVDFIWMAKDASELPTRCPELANWLNVWNDAEDETGKQTAKDMVAVVQQGILALSEKRDQYYFDMQKIEAVAAGGNLEEAEQKFNQVGAYADHLRTQFSGWIRAEITSKLEKLAGAREAAVTDGSATSRNVKIARNKLRAKPQRTGGKQGRKSAEGGASRGTRKKHEKKKKKPPAKVEEAIDE